LKAEKLVSAEAEHDQKSSRDAALIALAHARDQMAGPDDRRRLDRLIDGSPSDSKAAGGFKVSPPTNGAIPATPSERSVAGGKSIWRLLVGLGALLPIGAIVLGWHFLTSGGGEISSTSSVSKELVVASTSGTAAVDSDAVAAKKPAQAQPPSFVPARTELTQSIATMTHQLADSEREIEGLKAQQTKMLAENSARDKLLEEAQELARGDADLIRDLKSAQSQMAQDNANLAAQLKASQEQVVILAARLDASQIQMAKIAAQAKANQDQIARVVEQRQRAKPLIADSQPASGPTNKPTAKPRLQQTKPQTQNPAQAPTR
jgi:hypothetical protein